MRVAEPECPIAVRAVENRPGTRCAGAFAAVGTYQAGFASPTATQSHHQLRREPARVGRCFCLLNILRVESANSQAAERKRASESDLPQRSGFAHPPLVAKSPPMLGFSRADDR